MNVSQAQMRAARVAILPALLMGLLGGCTQRTLESEWEITLEQSAASPLEVIDYLPRPGTPGIPPHIEPYFFFNKAPNRAALDFSLAEVDGAGPFPFSPLYDTDGLGVRFIPDENVKPTTPEGLAEMSLFDGEDPLVLDSPFALRHSEGSYFNASTELLCTRFGGDPSHAKQLNNYMDPGVYPLFMLFAEGLTQETRFPATLNLYLGPAYFRDNGQIRVYRHIGYSTPMVETEIAADGSFSHSEAGTFFPLDTPDGVLLLYLDHVTISGKLRNQGGDPVLEDFSVSGTFPTRFLRILAEGSKGYSIAVSMLDLDVDLNGNGTPDSASFTVKSQPILLAEDEYAL